MQMSGLWCQYGWMGETSIFVLAGKLRWPDLPRPPGTRRSLLRLRPVSSVQTQPTNSIGCVAKPDAPPNPTAAVFLPHPYCWAVEARRPRAQAEGATVPSVCLALSSVGRSRLSQDHSESRTTGYERRYTWDSQTNSGIKDKSFHSPLKDVICWNKYDLHWSQSGVLFIVLITQNNCIKILLKSW